MNVICPGVASLLDFKRANANGIKIDSTRCEFHVIAGFRIDIQLFGCVSVTCEHEKAW